jgi:hypothetical protein
MLIFNIIDNFSNIGVTNISNEVNKSIRAHNCITIAKVAAHHQTSSKQVPQNNARCYEGGVLNFYPIIVRKSQ